MVCFFGGADVVAISFFFFQAEDGIRDYKVTGVQTCALPISDLRDPVPVPLGLAHRGVPYRRGDDRVRRDDGRAIPAHSYRPAMVLLLADSVPERARALAQLQVAAD